MPPTCRRQLGWLAAELLRTSLRPQPTALANHQAAPSAKQVGQNAPSACCRLFVTTVPNSGRSSTQWKARQNSDRFAKEAKVRGLKSRAAFKLIEMDAKYRLFKTGQTVIDLGYAPGSWSQVAKERTKPTGRVLGIDLIPAQPPRGVSTIQGNFLAPSVQELVKDFLVSSAQSQSAREPKEETADRGNDTGSEDDATDVFIEQQSYLEMERQLSPISTLQKETGKNDTDGRLVDVVLSDMSEPWPQTYGFWLNTLSNPYTRMMNTSGTPFRDHAGSMDLCNAALQFASDTLRAGGHFVCKFYQGAEDKALENRIKKLFTKVHREKPESSRSESREAYFVALKRRGDVTLPPLEE